jgi:hypothetical protein
MDIVSPFCVRYLAISVHQVAISTHSLPSRKGAMGWGLKKDIKSKAACRTRDKYGYNVYVLSAI